MGREAEMNDVKPPRRGWIGKFKLYFLTGLIALAPVAITAYILWNLFFTIDNWLAGIYRTIPWLTINGRPLPGLGFVSVIIIILLAGVVARNLVGGQLLRTAEQQLVKVPMVRGIYVAVKQISKAFFGSNGAIFRKVVMIPFPTRGIYAIGFLTADAAPEIQRKTNQEMVSVFLPTTPNPTSGYLLAVARRDVIELSMTVEEAMKLVISGGAVVPEDRVGEFLEKQVQDMEPADHSHSSEGASSSTVSGA